MEKEIERRRQLFSLVSGAISGANMWLIYIEIETANASARLITNQPSSVYSHLQLIVLKCDHYNRLDDVRMPIRAAATKGFDNTV